MTVHVQPPPVDAVAAADAWFYALGRPYLGRLAPDDPLLDGGGAGWLVSTLGRHLAVVVDPAFPYTRPKVYLRGRWPALPHVEADGRLCLRNPEIPSDPEAAVARALGAARDLLRAIESGSEDGDFQEDFGLYWRNHADLGSRARLLLPETDNSAMLAWTATGAAVYGFASPEALRRWWSHRFGSDSARSRQGALISLDRLPHPDLYPKTGTELWDLVASGSGDGTPVLGDLLRQTPKSLLIVLAGRAPSGRRHAVGLVLARPPDAKGRPVNRRVIEREHRRGETPPGVLCGRYVVKRLVTDALDAAGTRLPYPERDRLAAARVAVVGCGALGSGVARLLAKSGVGHLVLIDPEPLGWENIRRHQLGAGAVGLPKATTLAQAVAHENPDIGSVRGHDLSVEKLLVQDPASVAAVDLVVACTATWSANSALDDQASRGGPPVLFAWMEAHALAAHALLIMPGSSYSSGFDEVGNPRMTASVSRKPVPAECGALTSPFGAIELSHAEALTARLTLDFLRGKVGDTTWRTWLTDAAALTEAEGRWTEDWIEARGAPDPGGQISVGLWCER